jgi:hypothetical protein
MGGPAADPRDPLAHPLSYVRAVRGWTYQDVVNVVGKRIGNVARRREKAWRWEHWGVVPDWDSQLALAAELGVPEQQVRASPWPAWLPAGEEIPVTFEWNQQGSLHALEDAVEQAVLDRRGFMKISSSALVRIAEDWLQVEPAQLVAALDGCRIDASLIDRVEEGIPRLRFLDAAYGGKRARRLIEAELGMVTEILTHSAFSADLGRRLFAVAAELGRMAGWASFDDGLHAAAQRYWLAALHAAHAAGDGLKAANVLKSMSLQCHDFGRRQEALALAVSANASTSDATPRVAAMLSLREARAHAALSDRNNCDRLIKKAEQGFGRAEDGDDDPSWAGYFDYGEFYAQVGTCDLALGRARQAEANLKRALDSWPDIKVRDKATYTARRAAAHLMLGSADEAGELITEAVILIEKAPSQRNIDGVRKLRELGPFGRRDSRMAEVDARLSALVA